MTDTAKRSPRLGLAGLCAALLLTAACASTPREPDVQFGTHGLDLELRAMALREVKKLQNAGKRVWCVPFARNASGIEIRGNAETWWSQAAGIYQRGKSPQVGSVMAFPDDPKLTAGHVAVVSQVVSDREVLLDHANWSRNKVSLGMSAIDVSDAGDWSRVKLMSTPGHYGSVYPVSGFIYPTRVN